jgi:hypothetical protein
MVANAVLVQHVVIKRLVVVEVYVVTVRKTIIISVKIIKEMIKITIVLNKIE